MEVVFETTSKNLSGMTVESRVGVTASERKLATSSPFCRCGGMADTADSKSAARWAWGFKSPYRYHFQSFEVREPLRDGSFGCPINGGCGGEDRPAVSSR
jgi:hypothetical protein